MQSPLEGSLEKSERFLKKDLFLWIVATTDENGFMLGGDFIKEKAKEIAKELDISDHKFSDGWLQGLPLTICFLFNWL